MRLLREQPLDKVDMDKITNSLIEYGKGKIPEDVKSNAYKRIKDALENDGAYKAFINK